MPFSFSLTCDKFSKGPKLLCLAGREATRPSSSSNDGATASPGAEGQGAGLGPQRRKVSRRFADHQNTQPKLVAPRVRLKPVEMRLGASLLLRIFLSFYSLHVLQCLPVLPSAVACLLFSVCLCLCLSVFLPLCFSASCLLRFAVRCFSAVPLFFVPSACVCSSFSSGSCFCFDFLLFCLFWFLDRQMRGRV